jgi:hypothetical protein
VLFPEDFIINLIRRMDIYGLVDIDNQKLVIGDYLIFKGGLPLEIDFEVLVEFECGGDF